MFGTCQNEACGMTCTRLHEIHGMWVCTSCGIARLAANATHYDGRGDEFLSNSEIEEMNNNDAPSVSDEDWDFYFEALYCDPAEMPCCADRMCPCGGYVGNSWGPRNA